MDSNTADSHLPKSKQGRGGLRPPPSRQREPHTSFRGEVQRTTDLVFYVLIKNLLKNLTSLRVCSGLYAYAEHTHQELVRKLSIRARNWCACWAYASGTDAYAHHTHQFSIFQRPIVIESLQTMLSIRVRNWCAYWAYASGSDAYAEHTHQFLTRMLSMRVRN